MGSGPAVRRASHDGSVSSGGGGSRRGTDEAAPRPLIHPMPTKPLSLLRQLTGHIKVGRSLCALLSFSPRHLSRPCSFVLLLPDSVLPYHNYVHALQLTFSAALVLK